MLRTEERDWDKTGTKMSSAHVPLKRRLKQFSTCNKSQQHVSNAFPTWSFRGVFTNQWPQFYMHAKVAFLLAAVGLRTPQGQLFCCASFGPKYIHLKRTAPRFRKGFCLAEEIRQTQLLLNEVLTIAHAIMGRLGYRKSKNGCLRCKKRRVKVRDRLSYDVEKGDRLGLMAWHAV